MFSSAPLRFNNVHMLLVSGIGRPYNSSTREGTIGRNYAYQTTSGIELFFDDKIFNPFISSGALAQVVDDFNGEAFDHSRLDFVGGAGINTGPTNGRPIQTRPVPPGTPRWGAQWKQATKQNYLRFFSLGSQGSSYATHVNHLDLDPTYNDRLRSAVAADDLRFSRQRHPHVELRHRQDGGYRQGAEPATIVVSRRASLTALCPTKSTHNTGGAIMGADPESSAVNKYLQSWDVPNVFVVGSSAFPQNAGYNPTGTVGALAYFSADAIISKYLKSPGPLVRGTDAHAAHRCTQFYGAILARDPSRRPTYSRSISLERGRYLAVAADCEACHTKPRGRPYAGGVALETPFGTLVGPNITPDPRAGIGAWTDDEFVEALHEGRGRGESDSIPRCRIRPTPR